jgi:hypothetical protein
VDVAGHGDGAAFVGGVGDAVERLGGGWIGWIPTSKSFNGKETFSDT